MQGQWTGAYSGSNAGHIVVNIDDRGTHYEGVTYLLESVAGLPSSAAFFRTDDKSPQFKFVTQAILPISPHSFLPEPWASVQGLFPPGTTFPDTAQVSGSFGGNTLNLSWFTNIGTHGSCALPRSMADQPSRLLPLSKSWVAYKAYVAGLEGRRYLFRGQNRPWRLRTSFHRTGRANFHRFLDEDIQVLYRHLSARTKHVFNLEIGNENGAFFNLVQHHGYPTRAIALICHESA